MLAIKLQILRQNSRLIRIIGHVDQMLMLMTENVIALEKKIDTSIIVRVEFVAIQKMKLNCIALHNSVCSNTVYGDEIKTLIFVKQKRQNLKY